MLRVTAAVAIRTPFRSLSELSDTSNYLDCIDGLLARAASSSPSAVFPSPAVVASAEPLCGVSHAAAPILPPTVSDAIRVLDLVERTVVRDVVATANTHDLVWVPLDLRSTASPELDR